MYSSLFIFFIKLLILLEGSSITSDKVEIFEEKLKDEK